MYIKNKKKGFTLIELIIYLAVSLTIILILSDIFIVFYKSFNKNINKDSTINSIENGLVAIKDMVMDSRVVFKENKKNSLLIYQKFKDFYWVQSIYKKDSNLIVEYSEQYFNSVSIIKGRQTIIKNINKFYVYKKGNLLYIKIIKEGQEYIVSL